MDGGTIAIPFLHEISFVNMKTLRLEVHRTDDGSLITKDRMRVDVGVEFYVSVNATEDGISRAAQTLGDRTFNVDQLREMIEGKLIDGLRSVAARMTMDELHENRSEFVQEVQNAISEDLLKNGLELEAVSLTALDQTSFEALDENNAFNAVGMRKLAEVIAKSKKERAEIAAEADVAVRRAQMEAERLIYQIERDQREAEIAKIKEIQILQADQEAAIARNQEAADQAKEQARIEKERAIRSSEIERERFIRDAEIAKERELEVADQERQIIIAKKSEEESHARASADNARAEAKKAEEAVETARADAENVLSTEIIKMKIDIARLEALPAIIAEMVKPAEKIESIKIHQVTGLGGQNGGSSGGAGGTPVNQALDSIMGMALQMPAMKKLGEELGISLESGLAEVANDALVDGVVSAKIEEVTNEGAADEDAVA